MAWSGRHFRDTHIMQRIAAMLIAMSTMAENSASSPRAVRWAILWVFTLAFTATQNLVVDEASAYGFAIDASAMNDLGVHDSADDLRLLAQGFAGLARILIYLISHIHDLADEASAPPAPGASRIDARLLPLLASLRDWPRPVTRIPDT